MSINDIKEEPDSSEISTVFGRCRCCLEYGYMKNIWVENYVAGEREVFGEMLNETFAIAWDPAKDTKAYICDHCILRLRDAFNFKKEVLASEQLLNNDADGDADYDTQDGDEDMWYPDEGDLESFNDSADEEHLEESAAENEEYGEVEYLEEYATVVEDATKKSESTATKAKSRWSRKKRRDEISRPYLNYAASDMKHALEAVQEGGMSVADASVQFGVPRKTIAAKLHSLKHKNEESPEVMMRNQTKEKQYRFVEEVKKILEYTTAIPFKVKTGKYYCAYCYTSLGPFEHPSTLRTHSRIHEQDIKQIDRILRPQHQNEILRVDIEEFSCKVCDVPMPSWNDMFQHMNDVHAEEFDQAYLRLLPYKLTGEKVYCALCNAEFANFQFLDAHMNAHYCNYMCSDCGDSFVSEVRLKHHELIHNVGKHPCRYCGKVFTLEKYKKKHEAMVHDECKLFKCRDCGEQFTKDYERHLHTVKRHPERVRIMQCEFCGKDFDWRPYYLAHLRKAHSTFKKHGCKFCPKRFVTRHEVKMHEMRHTGGGQHVCVFCGKRFVTPNELRNHSHKHIKEIQEIQILPADS